MSPRVLGLALALLLAALRPAAAEAPPGMKPEYAKLYAEEPTVELVTMGIGALIWERHGHIALCLRYHDASRDVCYNYGIADFRHPIQMAWGFLRGTRSFWVGRQRPDEMLWIYQHADRTIWFQPIPLDAAQKQVVIDKLEFDVRDENRYYAYDHFDDNCTTRVRDILDNATGGALKSMTTPPGTGDGKTIRDLARDGFYGMRIPLLITDIAMGRSTDRVPTYWERMFLPQYLREAVHEKWGIEPYVAYARRGPKELTDGPSGRVWLALLGLLLTSPVWLTRLLGRFERTGLAIAVIPQVLLGCVFWFLAVVSPLPYLRFNETCLVLLPLDLLLLVLPAARARRYAQGRTLMLLAMLALGAVGIVKAPLWMLMLWPLVPAAVVGFWPVKRAP